MLQSITSVSMLRMFGGMVSKIMFMLTRNQLAILINLMQMWQGNIEAVFTHHPPPPPLQTVLGESSRYAAQSYN